MFKLFWIIFSLGAPESRLSDNVNSPVYPGGGYLLVIG